MRHEEHKGSVATSVIAACIFALILGVFGRSSEEERYQHPSTLNQLEVATHSTVIGSGFYWTHVIDEAKHQFLEPLKNFD